MTENYIVTNSGPITVSVPACARVTVEYAERRFGQRNDPNPRRQKEDERRGSTPRRMLICLPIVKGAVYGNQMIGRRKATFDRRLVNGVRRAVSTDHRIERRNPNRKMYQYRTSHDPRVRTLERRAMEHITFSSLVNQLVQRRSGEDRRVYQNANCIYGRRNLIRRKS